jgi:alpha-N-arabinofuranosidase
MKAAIFCDHHFSVGQIDPRIYGSFVEHLGRAVYGGIYEPGHPTADDKGFRQDVLELVRQMNVPMVRYPGGNFVSAYRWEDGTGDPARRPRVADPAWQTIEPNAVGIDEFQEWAKRAGAEVMMAVNLGTRGPEDAKNCVEYCNFPGGTQYSDLRRKNGFAEPFGIRCWCLGNEMDGPWQMGAKPAVEYARTAVQAAKMMKQMDPSIELTICGSSHCNMPTFVDWERTVLEEAYDVVDYISLHSYYGNPEENTPQYLACSREMDRYIDTVAAVCDIVKQKLRSEKDIYLSFDEWNVWFHSHEQDKHLKPWTVAPPRLEDIYNFEDALVVGCLLITLLRHADRVKMACLAQLVNVIAPIMTRTGGGVWAQTTFYPFCHASNYARGEVLQTQVRCPQYDGGRYGQPPYVEAVVTVDREKQQITVLAVNRSLTEDADLELTIRGFSGLRKLGHTVLAHEDMKICNTEQNPEAVTPKDLPWSQETLLPKHSWNLIRFCYDEEESL